MRILACGADIAGLGNEVILAERVPGPRSSWLATVPTGQQAAAPGHAETGPVAGN
ncbi:hypothetical protein [Amycolatopsis sp. WGS_07]|uniref:hypothetical protein n=1 Tax=Amycolatopsis sp. WGS_07 TaxID=3076764 RepID=UPI0038732B32